MTTLPRDVIVCMTNCCEKTGVYPEDKLTEEAGKLAEEIASKDATIVQAAKNATDAAI